MICRKKKRKKKDIHVRAAKPASVIWRESRLRYLMDVNPDSLFNPLSFTSVKERFILFRFFRPRNKRTII